MSEELDLPKEGTREELYRSLYPQLSALTADEPDIIANMANMVAALKEAFGFLWVGFYRVQGDFLVLGPFQGPLACTRIAYGRGVCGTAWKDGKTVVVADVDLFPGHIACSTQSRSEVVVPLFRDGVVVGVLDIDSEVLDRFDKVDARNLEKIVSLLKF